MRLFFVAALTTLLGLAGCHDSDLENRAAAAEAEKAKREAVENQLAAALEEKNQAEVRAEQLRAAADNITALEVDVTLHCTAGGDSSESTASKIMGGLELVRNDGEAWSLSESSEGSTPQVSSGICQAELKYIPDAPGDVIGRPITDLQSVQTLRAPYERLLSRMGASLAQGGTADVRLLVNKVEAFSVAGLPINSESDGMSSIAVGETFAGTFENYTKALGRRATGG